jgi:V/A-type H+/Na+-transporting ATPase subunit B
MSIRAELTASGGVFRIEGPLLFLRRNVMVGLGDAVEVIGEGGRPRRGRVATLDDHTIVVEVLESTTGLALQKTRVRIHREPMMFGVGPGLLGRVLSGVGRPIDGGPPVPASRTLRVEGLPIDPARRVKPHEFIETGFSTLDVLNSVVRGQKLPIFSEGGLPHDRMAAEIAARARLRGKHAERFAVVFAGIGVSYDAAEMFRLTMERSGALEHTVMFLNLASESSIERLLAPRFALTAAEYLAFVEGRHVLVVMTDMTSYCEALREMSASHGEIPSRKGYPGYMYSDLASLYERAGIVSGKPGSLTELAVLSVPAGDISHPIADLTGYITEGQIVLDRGLDRRGIYPPVEILPSLSRLMKDGIGSSMTDPDHPNLAQQLYASYAYAAEARTLASVVGIDSLTDIDRRHIAFGDALEQRLIHQQGRRSLEDSLRIGWELLRLLPTSELHRLSDQQLSRHVLGPAGQGGDDAGRS